MAPAATVQVDLLDGFEVRCEGERLALPPVAQRLVAFLALRDRPLQRLHVAGVLWLDASEERSCANLRSATCRRCRGRSRRAKNATTRCATGGSASRSPSHRTSKPSSRST